VPYGDVAYMEGPDVSDVLPNRLDQISLHDLHVIQVVENLDEMD